MRYVRNRVRVPGLAAASQATGSRKAPAYCLLAKRGGDAKPVFLSMGPSPRQLQQMSRSEVALHWGLLPLNGMLLQRQISHIDRIYIYGLATSSTQLNLR